MKSFPLNYDVIVVGAGPAGAIASRSLAMKGKKVALIDRRPREKIGDKSCGDGLLSWAFDCVSKDISIDLPHGEEVGDDLKWSVVDSDKGMFFLKWETAGYVLNRHPWGQRLLREAEEAGAVLWDNTRAIKALVNSNKVSGIEASTNNETIELTSKLVIDCSGTVAVIRKSLPESMAPIMPKTNNKKLIAYCFREIIELDNPHDFAESIVLRYDSDVVFPGYFWFFSKGKNRLNVGTGFSKYGAFKDLNVKEVYSYCLNKYFPKGNFKVLDSKGGQVPVSVPLPSMIAEGFICAGDAACNANPATAEGIGPALIAGSYAGTIGAQALDNDDLSVEALWKYNQMIMDAFGKDHAMQQLQIRALLEIGEDGFEFLLKRRILTPDDLAGDISLFSALMKVVRIFPRFGLLRKLLQLKGEIKKIREHYDKYPSNPNEIENWHKEMLEILNMPDFYN
ncbi:MAG: geranylgeranyl reductase family protein [Candidatus Kariarchaeaceae archaeon]